MIRSLLLLVTVLALMGAARSFAPLGLPHTPGTGTVLGFGFLVLAALQAGRIFAALRLPRLTGYLLCGLATGPDVLGLLSPHNVSDLRIVNGVAVSLIALTAGSELDLKIMRPRIRGVMAVVTASMLLAVSVITLVAYAASSQLAFLAELPPSQRWSVALTIGVLLASLSPAVTIAILAETRAAGPVSEFSLGVVVLADIVIIVAFTAVNALDASVFGTHGASSTELPPIARLAIEIGGSALVGGVVALALLAWHRVVKAHLALFIVAVCIIATEVGARLHLDALVVCLTAGLLLQNVLRVPTEVLERTLAPAGLPIFAVFCALAGANLKLAELRALWPMALLFAVTRALTLFAGTHIGARLTDVGEGVRRWMPFSLLAQAGVSVGLADLMARHFPQWGVSVRALVLSVMTLNVIAGPLLFRLALTRAGEAGKRTEHAHDGH
ncbi:MAG: cation:proton antiporter [Polyangiales bacterium]